MRAVQTDEQQMKQMEPREDASTQKAPGPGNLLRCSQKTPQLLIELQRD
jgi:hypothetical protein